jgi:hypothetical protein
MGHEMPVELALLLKGHVSPAAPLPAAVEAARGLSRRDVFGEAVFLELLFGRAHAATWLAAVGCPAAAM